MFERWDENLNHKERLFCIYYCSVQDTFMDGPASYREAYTVDDQVPQDSTCASNSSRLLKRENVRTAINKLLKITRTELTEEYLAQALEALKSMAFYNPAEILDKDGELVTETLEELGEKAKCIAQIVPMGNGKVRYVLADRSKYLKLLLKYFEIAEQKQETSKEGESPGVQSNSLVEQLLANRVFEGGDDDAEYSEFAKTG